MDGHKYLTDGYWASKAIAAWLVTHPDMAAARVYAVVPGNTLSAKDPRPDVHSLHTADAICGQQFAQGSADDCRAAWPEIEAELVANGCTVAALR